MKFVNNKLLTIAAMLTSVLPLIIHFYTGALIEIYTIIWIASSAFYLLFSYLLFNAKPPARAIFFFTILAVGVRFSFITSAPIGSDDIYRYMWDGKLQSAGINPYLYTPNDPSLIHLHSETLPDKVNFPDMKTIYFPLSQWLFYIGYQISGEDYWGYKLLLLIAELITFFFLLKLVSKSDRNKNFLLLYFLCPLPVIQFAVDAHLDGFGLPLLAASLFYFNKRRVLSLILLGLSLSIKPIGLLFLPVLLIGEKKINEWLKVILIPALSFFAQFVPYIWNTNPFEALFIYAKNWSYNGLLFKGFYLITENNQTARLLSGAILVLLLVPVYFSKRWPIDKFYYAILLLLILSPVVHPWYIGWLAVLIPLTCRWSGISFAALSSLTAFTVLSYQTAGVWKEYAAVLAIEYLPVLFFMIYELFSNIKTNRQGVI